MSAIIEDIEWSIRPSQLVNIFGPGAIYDNLKDSVLILGTDYWDPNKFNPITDPYLLAQVKKNSTYFAMLKSFASVSSSTDESSIPVQSFPTWGVCTECGFLQRRHGQGTSHEFECRSRECDQNFQKKGIDLPKTVPVRFVVACENGHLDDFPFYEWAHKGKTVANCSKAEALLYIEDRENSSSSLDSKFVVCRNCHLENDMGMALTKTGVEYVTGKLCDGNMPWLKLRKHGRCHLPAVGMLKGSSNLYFPYTRSALTIPPFSDELSQEILRQWEPLIKFSKKSEDLFRAAIETLFDVRTPENPNGKYTVEKIIDKFKIHLDARTKQDLPDIFELEFKELNSGYPIDEKEFKTENGSVPKRFENDIDKIVLVKKLRQLVTITGFSRLNPLDPADMRSITPISSSPPEWLPAVENRGEGIFLSLNQDALRGWENLPHIIERTRKILDVERGQPQLLNRIGKLVNSRYILLHSLSHLLIRSLSELAGYSTASIQERIYNSPTMAGILIFTSSVSSDGSLGGLVEQGSMENFYQIIQRALGKSKLCSSDPLCSFNKPDQRKVRHGAACHACLFLPEPACESMNEFLDRSLVLSTLEGSTGYFIRGNVG